MNFFLKLALWIIKNNERNVITAKPKPRRPLLEPIQGKTNNPKIIKNKKNNLKFLRKAKTIPKSKGNKEDKITPKEFGSLKVELI